MCRLLPLALFILLAGPAGSVLAGDGTAPITLSGTLIDSPPCDVNGGNTIDVDFGDEVMTTRIDGKAYDKQPVNYTLECDSSMDAGTQLAISIRGQAAAFGSGLLQTDVAGLGVQFMSGDAPVPLNNDTALKFAYDNSGTGPKIDAVLARNPAVTLSGGAFSATATMFLNYQ
jgi:type 1 fimbria pilin